MHRKHKKHKSRKREREGDDGSDHDEDSVRHGELIIIVINGLRLSSSLYSLICNVM